MSMEVSYVRGHTARAVCALCAAADDRTAFQLRLSYSGRGVHRSQAGHGRDGRRRGQRTADGDTHSAIDGHSLRRRGAHFRAPQPGRRRQGGAHIQRGVYIRRRHGAADMCLRQRLHRRPCPYARLDGGHTRRGNGVHALYRHLCAVPDTQLPAQRARPQRRPAKAGHDSAGGRLLLEHTARLAVHVPAEPGHRRRGAGHGARPDFQRRDHTAALCARTRRAALLPHPARGRARWGRSARWASRALSWSSPSA